MGTTFFEANLWRLIVRFGTLYAVTRVRDSFQTLRRDRFAACFAFAIRAVVDTGQSVTSGGHDELLVCEERRVHIVQVLFSAHIAKVERSVGKFAPAVAATSGQNLIDYAVGIRADAIRKLFEKFFVFVSGRFLFAHDCNLYCTADTLAANRSRANVPHATC